MTHSNDQLDIKNVSYKFSDLNISEELIKGVKELGYESPTPYQKNVFDNFKDGNNIAGKTSSNYGKSLAFFLPILNKISPDSNELQAIIVLDNSLQSDLRTKECKALAKYLNINVSNTITEDKPQILLLTVESLENSDIPYNVDHVTTIFFDDLTTKNSTLILGKLKNLIHKETQILLYGDDTIDEFKNHHSDLLDSAVLVANEDKPKISLPSRHIFHQAKEDEPKPRALLAALELHNPTQALITCNDSQECELLARYLARYGHSSIIANENSNSHRIKDALKELDEKKVSLVICQNNLLSRCNLEHVPFMINYDMFERPQVYEQVTQFNKQANDLNRVIVNLLTSRELGYIAPIKAQCLINFEELALPSEDEVLELSSKRIISKINQEASMVELSQFEELAQRIINNKDAKLALSFLLRNHLLKSPEISNRDKKTSERRYERREKRDHDRPEKRERRERDHAHNVKEDQQSNDSDITRLYITIGKQDGFLELSELAQYLSEQSGVDLGHFSGGGMVRDNSSHIEVDNDVAQSIIDSMHNRPRPQTNPDGGEGSETQATNIICEKAKQSNYRPRRPMNRGRRPRGYNNRRH